KANLFFLLAHVPTRDILKLCYTEKQLKTLLCRNNDFWFQRANQKFGLSKPDWLSLDGLGSERYLSIEQTLSANTLTTKINQAKNSGLWICVHQDDKELMGLKFKFMDVSLD